MIVKAKERPLPLRTWEIRAILDGRKNQMRRPVKPQPKRSLTMNAGGNWRGADRCGVDPKSSTLKCPYGKIGDQLWVRETWHPAFKRDKENNGCIYKADYGHRRDLVKEYDCDWIRSIHMPKWASRLTLEVTNVRIERATDISEEDAKAEGGKPICVVDKFENMTMSHTPRGITMSGDVTEWHESFSGGFQIAWDERYKKKYPWSSKPYAWVIDFKKL